MSAQSRELFPGVFPRKNKASFYEHYDFLEVGTTFPELSNFSFLVVHLDMGKNLCNNHSIV